MTGGLLAIAGFVRGTGEVSTASYYEIAKNTWKRLDAELNIARHSHSACTLNGIVYVFCGIADGSEYVGSSYLNSIEWISENTLLADKKKTFWEFITNATTRWQLILVAENILRKRAFPAVTPLNDTEIAILGGRYVIAEIKDVIVFNPTSLTCQNVEAGDHIFDFVFSAIGNQCVQTGTNKVVELAKDKNGKPVVISWTKGASAVTTLENFGF